MADERSEQEEFRDLLPAVLVRVKDALAKYDGASRKLKTRAMNVCRRQGIYLLGELAACAEVEVLKMQQVGVKMFDLFRNVLQQYGLRLGMVRLTEEQYWVVKACAGALRAYLEPTTPDFHVVDRLVRDYGVAREEAERFTAIAQKTGWIKPWHDTRL